MATAPSRKIPISVNDFVVLPLKIPAQSSYPHASTHYLYLRPNAPKAPTANTPREVFLVNLPVDATDQLLRGLFSNRLGGARIDHIAFEGARVGKGISAPVAPTKSKKRKRGENDAGDKEVGLLPETWDRELHRSGATAIVTFVDKASAEMALKEARRAAKGKREIVWQSEEALGSMRYLAHHKLQYPDRAVLQQSVDAFMTAFAAQEEEKAKILAKQRNEPDEDGFITVTRGGRVGPARDEEARTKEEELRKREKKRVGGDFYRFQVREKMKDQAKDLVRGFEEDQKRVEEMKKRKWKLRPD